MSRPQAVDLYQVQRQLEREIHFWGKLGEGQKPTLLDAVRVVRGEQSSLIWDLLEQAQMKVYQTESTLMEIVLNQPGIKTEMTKLNPEVFIDASP